MEENSFKCNEMPPGGDFSDISDIRGAGDTGSNDEAVDANPRPPPSE